jgi:hypothetical protein
MPCLENRREILVLWLLATDLRIQEAKSQLLNMEIQDNIPQRQRKSYLIHPQVGEDLE